MREAVEAYTGTARVTNSPRQLEASLLLKSASQLQQLHDNWSVSSDDALDTALHYNRRLWTIFASAVAEDSSPLPLEIRNNVASLGVFVFKHSLELQREPAPEKLIPLININKEIAAGLKETA